MSIVVPDNRDALLQLLAFVYTLQLVDTSSAALLQGISTADRYKVEDMKCKLARCRGTVAFRILGADLLALTHFFLYPVACASALKLTADNLLDTLYLLQRIEIPILNEVSDEPS